jgi:hypothetical protein
VHKNSKRLFGHLSSRGNLSVIWVVNTREDMVECNEKFGTELNGLMTDYPTDLEAFARDKKEESKSKLV